VGTAVREVGFIARRSLRHTLRQPFLIVPSVAFPLFLLAVNSSGLGAAPDIPGFTSDSYLDFALAVTFMQGALFAAVNAGTALAADVESGFLNRLSLTPLRGVAVLVGQLAGAALLGLISAIAYVAVGLTAGVSIESGIGGALVLLAFALVTATAFSGIGAFLGLRTGSSEAVQGMFPLLFVWLFLSSMYLPRDLIEIDWFRTIATYNPVSYLIEAMRSLVITGWDSTALLRGVGVAAAIGLVSFVAASRALRTRMERT
jgi:ABC-2 type transport system permease protein